MIERPEYLKRLIQKKENGKIKVITGIRRCGKSFLLTKIFYNYLKGNSIDDSHIIIISLEESENARYRNPIELDNYLKSKLVDSKMHYIILDEIQKVKPVPNPYLDDERIGFSDVLLGLMKKDNVDIYVTGSNSIMLSSDILTEFRGRGDEIHIYPLSYKEILNSSSDKDSVWKYYFTYGGMPDVVLLETHQEKQEYLKNLFNKVYLTDIKERHNLKNDDYILTDLLSFIASSIGSLTNPNKLANTFKSKNNVSITPKTISRYLNIIENAYLINEAKRYDIKGKNYIGSPLKYYFSDIGLRNAMLNFRQQEETHIMENIIYNELIQRGYSVDIGIVEISYRNDEKKSIRKQLEIDFIVNDGNNRLYIQSAYALNNDEKIFQETNGFNNIKDSFKKIVIVKDDIVPWYNEKGILFIGLKEFLLSDNIFSI